MDRPNLARRVRLGIPALLITTVAGYGQGQAPPNRALALVGGVVYASPTEDPIRNGVVLIREGRIAAVGRKGAVSLPRGTRILDCSGLAITSGFWNSHVHFLERKWNPAARIPAPELTRQLQEMLTRYGFTSVFDTWSTWENTRRLRERIESGEISGPGILSTGEALIPKGGKPPEMIPEILGFTPYDVPEVANAAEARAAAVKLLDSGVDAIKLYARTFSQPIAALPETAIQAAVAEAHRRGKLAFAHPTNLEGLLASVNGGVDVIVHTTPQSGPWGPSVLAAMKKRGVSLIPTLQLWRYEIRHDRVSAQDRFVNNGVAQLRAWLDVGGTVLFGTDVGYMANYNPGEEYALMAEAGMDFRQVLASLTTTPAERFGLSARLGKIATGLAADIVVLNQDPAKNIRAFADVRYAFRDGKMLFSTRKEFPIHLSH